MDVLGSVAYFVVYLYMYIGRFYGTVSLLIIEINDLMKNGNGCLFI